MDARSEEIGRLLREQEQAIIAERAQAVRMAGAAQQAAITGQVVSAPGEILLCEQRWCQLPGGTGPALATCGLARADGNGAWLSCDACAARMLGDARYPVVVISLGQWRYISQLREQEIARQIAEGKAGQVAAVTAGGSPADPPPAITAGPGTAPPDGSQWLARARPWLIAAAVSVVLGIIFVAAGAEMNSPDAEPATPGAPELWIGGILIVVPLLAIAISVAISVIRFGAEQARRYRAWKKTLTPEHLAMVRMAEAAATFAALEGAHLYMKRSNQRMRERQAARQARWDKVSGWKAENSRQLQDWQQQPPGPSWSQQEPRPRMWRQP